MNVKNYWFRFKTTKIYGYLFWIFNLGMLIFLPIFGYELLGLWGFFLGIILFLLIKLLLSRRIIMYLVREMETTLFGKPLDKENWEKGEFKMPKLVWRKKNERGNKKVQKK